MKKAKEIKTDYDCIVIGAGHAGCEASLASARLGCKTLVVTMNLDSIAFLACNPSIGGTAKGHLVCEIDALGGQMGIIADATALQIKMLNTSNGPAVHSLRAQSDKYAYHTQMKKVLEAQENLHIKQGEIISIKQIEEINLWQATLATGLCYTTKTIVVATGVYLNSRILMGSFTKNIGPNGFEPSTQFTQSLEALGYTIRRFKTGTPCRVAGKSIDFSKTQIQSGDDNLPYSFSALSTTPPKNVANCYLTYTNPKTHKIIQDNITKSPMYNGLVKGTGARYCPSIEDKITRFADKDRHQVFLEPEGAQSDEIYLQGISTSLPVDVQEQFVKSIVGLEKAQIMRNAYAIEYDCIDSLQLYPTLQSKMHAGLFFAGQINGTSGYEEAAAQGLIAGLNAALTVKGKPLYTPTRDTSYIGVLIDDLTTKGTNEPYRMMTSRAEYRITLRQDNADIRLTEISHKLGLATKERYKLLKEKVANPNANYKEIDKMYAGYLKRMQGQINDAQKAENIKLPQDFDYSKIKGLRIEAQQKLNIIKPQNIGQASRISGVNPADISVLLVYLKTIKADK